MKRLFFYAPDPNQQGGGGSTTPVVVAKTIEQLLADNMARSSASKATVMEVIVNSVSGWKATSDGREVVMVTTNIGNFWPLKSSIKNCPTSFLKPAAAKAVVMPRLDRTGVERLNLSSLEFEGLANDVAMAIDKMPAGTALFASAAAMRS